MVYFFENLCLMYTCIFYFCVEINFVDFEVFCGLMTFVR